MYLAMAYLVLADLAGVLCVGSSGEDEGVTPGPPEIHTWDPCLTKYDKQIG